MREHYLWTDQTPKESAPPPITQGNADVGPLDVYRHMAQAENAHPASAITVTPVDTLTGTDVQASLEALAARIALLES